MNVGTGLLGTWVCCKRVEMGKVEGKRKGKEAIKRYNEED